MKRSFRLYIPLVSVCLVNLLILGSAAATTPSGTTRIADMETGYQSTGSVISQIEAIHGNDGVAVLISGTKDFAYTTYRFENPPRLAIDVPNSELRGVPESLTIDKGPVTSIVNREFRNEKEHLTRIEIRLADDKFHDAQVTMVGKTLTVLFPGQFERTDSRKVLDRLEGSPPAVTQTIPRRVNSTDVPFIRTAQNNANMPSSRLLEQTIGTEEDNSGDMEASYEGVPISLDLKDADVVDIFLTISELTGYNIVVDPNVKGKINIRMNEVPWDQALDIILKQLELGKEFTGLRSEEYPKGNIIRIAPVRKLQKEAEDRRSLINARKIAEPLTTKIFYLSYADAAEMQAKIKSLLSERGQIIIDKRTNALIVTDISANLDKVKNMITLLDVRTKQVLISAQIVTTKKDFTRDLGIQWGGKFVADAVHGNTTGYRFPNYYTVDGSSNGGYAVNMPAGSPIIGLSLGNVLNTLQLNFLLSAGESEGITKVLSSPRVMTSDNVSAEIKTGTQIAYTVFSDRGLEVQFKDAVISLNVTPHITNDNYIKMKIEAKKDSPDFSVTPPAINTNNAKTEVLVKDGDTIVIGGLNQSTEGWSEERIPLLHRIPFLGWLFKNHKIKNEYNDLLIFIAPKIVAQERAKIQAITFDQGSPAAMGTTE